MDSDCGLSFTGSILAALANVLFDYPFPCNAHGLRSVSASVSTLLMNQIIGSLCWIVGSKGFPEGLVAESLVCLGALQGFDIWSDECVVLLREQLSLESLVLRAADSISSFAPKKGKVIIILPNTISNQQHPAYYWLCSMFRDHPHRIGHRLCSDLCILCPKLQRPAVHF